jgi:hypothetical protein
VAQTLPLFIPHPNLSDTVNRLIIESEIEGGVFLAELPPASVLEIQTQHHDYRAVTLSENSVLISGHPEYCPEPVLVASAGSTWGGSMLKRGFVGRGMHRCTWSFLIRHTALLSSPRVSRRFASALEIAPRQGRSTDCCVTATSRQQLDPNIGTDHAMPQRRQRALLGFRR